MFLWPFVMIVGNKELSVEVTKELLDLSEREIKEYLSDYAVFKRKVREMEETIKLMK